MAALRAALMQRASLLLPAPDGFAINRRQRQLIAALASELELAISQSDLLIAAEHLRQARAALDRLVGRTGVEDMLDAIFGGFCIGK
jgi:tRNA modification GTPase